MFDQPISRAQRHIVWDWNGTLLDDNDAVVSAVNSVCADFGREPTDLATWRAFFGRPVWRSYERLLERELGERDWAWVDRRYHEVYRELLHTCRLAAGVPDVLHHWQNAGRTQSLLSMWFHDELLGLVDEFELAPLFSRVDGLRADVGGESKAAHLAKHVRAHGLDPADVLLVGDAVDDARAAGEVGTSCALVSTGMTSAGALEPTGYPVADSIPRALEAAGLPVAA